MLKHKDKVKLARHFQEAGVPLFQSRWWRIRKYQIQQRVLRREARAKYHKELRQGVR